MATCLVSCIQKIPNEMPIKWLIMTVSKYICICISLQKLKQRIREERGLITAITIINVFFFFKWCYFREDAISKSVLNVRPGHLSYKNNHYAYVVGFLKKKKKTWTRKAKVGPMGVNWGLIAFLWESPHVTSICYFGCLPNRTSLRECLLDSISTVRVSSLGWGSLWPSPASGSYWK